MKQYLTDILARLGYTDGDSAVLLDAYNRMMASPQAADVFTGAIRAYGNKTEQSWSALLNLAKDAAELAGVHIYTAHLLFCLCLTEETHRRYLERGISDEIFYDSMRDLLYKNWECKAIKGVVGTFVAHWFDRWFDVTRFALGRLQFEVIPLPADYAKGDLALKKGDPVINVHIPRTCTPLSEEACRDSYAKAAAFFAKELGEVPVAFVCDSWLLYPPYRSVFAQGSNTHRFVCEFDVVHQRTDPPGRYNDAWRLFDMDQPEDLSLWPEDSSMRRALKSYYLSGGSSGEGMGIFFYKQA